MRLSIQKLASVVLGVVALASFAPPSWISSARAEGEEQQCRQNNGNEATVTVSTCTLTTKKLAVATSGCQAGNYLVLAVSCSDQITTYSDDACDGEPGECSPAVMNPDVIKTIKESASPNLAVGQCLTTKPTNATCKCTPNGVETYIYGRKTCNGA